MAWMTHRALSTTSSVRQPTWLMSRKYNGFCKENEERVCGDRGSSGADTREELHQIHAGFLIAAKSSQVGAIKNKKDRGVAACWQTVITRLRAIVAHPYRAIKRQFGDSKVRYRAPAKNTAQVLTLFALSNLSMVRRHGNAPDRRIASVRQQTAIAAVIWDVKSFAIA